MSPLLFSLLLATPPSVAVPIAEECPREGTCRIVVMETLETPPDVPKRTAKGKYERFTVPAIESDDYELIAACAPGAGTYIAVGRSEKRGVRSKVRVVATGETFEVEMDGPYLRRSCRTFPFSSVRENECPKGMPCIGDIPPKGTRFIAMLERDAPDQPWRFRPANWKRSVRLPTGETIRSYVRATDRMIEALPM